MESSQQIDLFKGFPFPRTNEQEVLLTLITQGHASFLDFSYMQGFRTRISNLSLVHGLPLERKTDKRCNKFGNSYTYAIHILPREAKDKAIDLYKKLTNQ
jgi:hypothetical protein